MNEKCAKNKSRFMKFQQKLTKTMEELNVNCAATR